MPKPDLAFPALSTGRLLLRAPAAEDVGAFHGILAIREVTRFSSWPDAGGKTMAERAMRWMRKAYPSGGGCAWMIEDRESKTLIGAIRFNSFVKKSKCGEVGYELHPAFWGRGLMTEAVIAVAECGHRFFGLNRIEAWTLPGNPGSDRVLEKAGFRYEGTLRQKALFKGAYHDFRMFGRLADDHGP